MKPQLPDLFGETPTLRWLGSPQPGPRLPFVPRTLFPLWGGLEMPWAEAEAGSPASTGAVSGNPSPGHQEVPVPGDGPGDGPGGEPLRPRLLVAGAQTGSLSVVTWHLIHEGHWEVRTVPSFEAVESILGAGLPDLILAVWTDDAVARAQVSAIRHHPSGHALPVLFVGHPPRPGESVPVQPVRGVLCLPHPLKWRTLLVCLEEHRRLILRKPRWAG